MNTKAVYMIKCDETGLFYIGSSKNIWQRFDVHKYQLKHNKHNSYLLQKHFNKFGGENILMKVIEYVDDSALLKEREKHYILLMKPKFNTYIGFRGGKNTRKTKKAGSD